MNNMSNMSIWDKNKAIDPRYTKNAKVKGQNITTFSLASVVMMATDQWGPFGVGWGYTVDKERFDKGPVIQDARSYKDEDGTTITVQEERQTIHTLLVKLWYVHEGSRIECPVQAGHTPYMYKSKYGVTCDDEYYKKTLADGIKKSLSMLGFAADIFLGLMDDRHYQNLQEEERQLQAASKLPEEIEGFKLKVDDWCRAYNANTIGPSIMAQHSAHVGECNRLCRKMNIDPSRFLDKLQKAKAARIETLKSKVKGEK